jgi:hypothetical protein
MDQSLLGDFFGTFWSHCGQRIQAVSLYISWNGCLEIPFLPSSKFWEVTSSKFWEVTSSN